MRPLPRSAALPASHSFKDLIDVSLSLSLHLDQGIDSAMPDIWETVFVATPGLMHFHTTFVWRPNRNHPLAGRTIDPRGYPGRFIVTLILRRQGAPDNPRAIQMDQGLLEGDSHLHLPEEFSGQRNTEEQPQIMSIREKSSNYPCAAFITSLKVMRPSTPEPLILERFTPRSSALCLAAFVASGSSSIATNSLAMRDLTLTLRYVLPC